MNVLQRRRWAPQRQLSGDLCERVLPAKSSLSKWPRRSSTIFGLAVEPKAIFPRVAQHAHPLSIFHLAWTTIKRGTYVQKML